LQLKHVGVVVVLSLSGHSLCRWRPPHHIQRGGCLQIAQTWRDFWQMRHCVRSVRDLYSDCNIANAYRRVFSLNRLPSDRIENISSSSSSIFG
jgi:hypothetical protein